MEEKFTYEELAQKVSGASDSLYVLANRLDKHFKVLHDARLTAEIAEFQRAQCIFKLFFALRKIFLANIKIFVHIVLILCKDTKIMMNDER